VIGLLAHGGVGGAIVEVGLVLTILAVFFAVWRRERGNPSAGDGKRQPVKPEEASRDRRHDQSH
jgi:hypothetical protein